MDKRKNKILMGCLALLLVMTVGYALFSENITINGMATAKGDFDITTTCETGINSKLLFDISNFEEYNKEMGYENDECLVTNNKVTMKVDFLYPSATRYFTVKMTNTGTIDATLDSRSITVKVDYCTGHDSSGNDKECGTNDGYLGSFANINADMYTEAYVNFENSDGLKGITSDNVSDDGNIFTLKPNESLYLVFQGRFDETWGNDLEYTNGSFYQEYSITYTLPWKQVTAN